MSIVTISRGSYSRGREVAERLADALGYECVSREIVLEATGQFNIPEIKMVRAIHDAPSILERFTYGKERYVAFFKSAFLAHMKRDRVVYHGLAGHFFLQDVRHALKIRIIANMNDRIVEEMKRENVSRDEARSILARDDAERRKWSQHLYGIDTWDPMLYDVVYHTSNLSVDDIVDCIITMLDKPNFRTTEDSQRRLADLALAARVEAALVTEYPRVEAVADSGRVIVSVRARGNNEAKIAERVEELLNEIDEITSIETNVIPFMIRD